MPALQEKPQRRKERCRDSSRALMACAAFGTWGTGPSVLRVNRIACATGRQRCRYWRRLTVGARADTLFTSKRGARNGADERREWRIEREMKIIVADKISERGVALLREAGWDVVTPAAAALPRELSDADALIIRSQTTETAP